MILLALSVDSLLKFADALYMEGDPYRAALEYKRVLYLLREEGRDTGEIYGKVLSKMVGAHISAGDPIAAIRALDYWATDRNSRYYRASMGTLQFLIGNYKKAERLWKDDDTLRWVARMMLGDPAAYDVLGRPPGIKSPTLSAVLSAIVPGSGKVYAGRFYDGLYSFLLSAAMAYGLYEALKDESKLRAATFGVGFAYFYLGNVYGSYIAVKKMNDRIKLEYVTRWLPIF